MKIELTHYSAGMNPTQVMAFIQTRTVLFALNPAYQRPVRSQSFPMVRREVRHGR